MPDDQPGHHLTLEGVPGRLLSSRGEGSPNDYDYAMGDPINQFDLGGKLCQTVGRSPSGSVVSRSTEPGHTRKWFGVAATAHSEEVPPRQTPCNLGLVTG